MSERGHGVGGTATDDGMSLIELIVYIMLAALMLGLLTLIFTTGLSSQASTTERDAATAQAGAVSASLQSSIRNASAFRLGGGGTVVRAKVAIGDADAAECRGWAISDGELKYATGALGDDLGDPADWSVTLAEGVTGVFSASPDPVSGRELTYRLTLATGEQRVPFSGGVTAQAKIPGADSCW